MIEVKHLSKQFGAFKAVDDISFSAGKGEVLGFLGPNGAGKSTTMKMITGFLTPTSGDISVCSNNVLTDPIKTKKSLGYLPEGAPSYPDMTPLSFLHFIAEIRGFRGNEINKRVVDAANRVNLHSVMNRPIETLSKGFKRRVGFAQAILHDPDVLIMDEPTDGLDPNQKHEVRLLIKEMAKNKTIVVSTHILEEVQSVCTRAIIIAHGKLLFDGTPFELESRSKYHNAITLTVQTDSPDTLSDQLMAQLKTLPSVDSVENITTEQGKASFSIFPKKGASISKEVHSCIKTNNWEIDEFHVESGSLDEVFRDITTSSDISAKGALT
ncbi:MAG: ATP-binding cassette domain-containing protein [Gammaproteobacteria bacterium]|nr:ATP-binding cassette domain-containing protein [Gammaproteobacteria bacterium]